MKKSNVVLIVFVFLLSFVGYWAWRDYGELSQLVVGPKWVNQAQFAGLFVAQEQGMYRKRGLKVVFNEFGFETNTIADLLAGKTDFAITSAEELMLARDRGEKVVAVAAFYQTSPYVIASLKKEGIETPADLKGKILGSKGGKVEEELIYHLLMGRVGIRDEDVAIKKIGFEKREIDDLVEGRVQAIDLYRTDQLYFFEKEGIEYNVIYPEQFGVNLINDVLVTKEEMVQDNPELVNAFVVASIEGWSWAMKNQEQAVKETMKYVTNATYKDLDYEKYILKQSIFLIKRGSGGRVGSMNYQQWDKLKQQMKESGFIKNELKVEDLYTNMFLQ